jgi:hypothetical protein
VAKKFIDTTIYPEHGQAVSRKDYDENQVVTIANQEHGDLVVRLRVNKNGAISLRVSEGQSGQEYTLWYGQVLTERRTKFRNMEGIVYLSVREVETGIRSEEES